MNEKLKKKLTFVECLLSTKSCNIFQVRKDDAVMIWSVTLLLLFRGCQVPGIMWTHDPNIPSVGYHFTSLTSYHRDFFFFFYCFCHNIVDSQEWFTCYENFPVNGNKTSWSKKLEYYNNFDNGSKEIVFNLRNYHNQMTVSI